MAKLSAERQRLLTMQQCPVSGPTQPRSLIGSVWCVYSDVWCVCVPRDEREYESEVRRQQGELAELSAERHRLLTMQQHLLQLQQSLAAATSAAASQVTSLSRIYEAAS